MGVVKLELVVLLPLEATAVAHEPQQPPQVVAPVATLALELL